MVCWGGRGLVREALLDSLPEVIAALRSRPPDPSSISGPCSATGRPTSKSGRTVMDRAPLERASTSAYGGKDVRVDRDVGKELGKVVDKSKKTLNFSEVEGRLPIADSVKCVAFSMESPVVNNITNALQTSGVDV